MKLLSTLLCVPLAFASVLPAGAGAPDVSLAERDAIVQTVTRAALADLKLKGEALRLTLRSLQRSGDWVFIKANMQGANGKRFDYANTDRHDAAEAGAVSDVCAALLKREGASWKLVEIAVGPNDVAWESWPAEHQAPASLFE